MSNYNQSQYRNDSRHSRYERIHYNGYSNINEYNRPYSFYPNRSLLSGGSHPSYRNYHDNGRKRSIDEPKEKSLSKDNENRRDSKKPKLDIKSSSLTFGHILSEECLKTDELLKDCGKVEVDGEMKDLVTVQCKITIYRDHIKKQKTVVDEIKSKLEKEQEILTKYQETYDNLIKQSKKKFDEITKDYLNSDPEATKEIINIDDSSSGSESSESKDRIKLQKTSSRSGSFDNESSNSADEKASSTTITPASIQTDEYQSNKNSSKSKKPSNNNTGVPVPNDVTDKEEDGNLKKKKKKSVSKLDAPSSTTKTCVLKPSLETISICKDEKIQIFDMKIFENYLYVAGSHGTLLQIDLENHSKRKFYRGQFDHVHSILLTKSLSIGGSWLISGGFTKKLMFHKVENEIASQNFFMTGYIMCICENSKWLYCGCSDGFIGIYNYEDCKRRSSVKITKNNIGICSLASCVDDSHYFIFVGTEDSRVIVLNGSDYTQILDLTPDAMKHPVIDFLILPCYRLLIFEKNNIHITKFGDRLKGPVRKHSVPVTHNHIFNNNSLYFTSKYAYIGHTNGCVDIYKVDGSSIRKVPIQSYIKEVSPVRAIIEYNNVIISGNSKGKIYFNRSDFKADP